jgi:hypothetical protein
VLIIIKIDRDKYKLKVLKIYKKIILYINCIMNNLEQSYQYLLNKYFAEYQLKYRTIPYFTSSENYRFNKLDMHFSTMNMDELADHADYVTRNMCDQTEFIDEKKKWFRCEILNAKNNPGKYSNSCSIANLARICKDTNQEKLFNEVCHNYNHIIIQTSNEFSPKCNIL